MYIYQVIIEYDGTNFVGWQMQTNGMSIQETIQKTLTKMLKQKITLHGSGRTDSGVHAIAQSAHFLTKKKIDNQYLFLNTLNFVIKKFQSFDPDSQLQSEKGGTWAFQSLDSDFGRRTF